MFSVPFKSNISFLHFILLVPLKTAWKCVTVIAKAAGAFSILTTSSEDL